MKNTVRKTFAPLLCGASLLTMAGLYGPAMAQQATPALPKIASDPAPALTANAAKKGADVKNGQGAKDPKKDSIEEKRKLLDVDPSVVDAVDAFDRNDFIVTREKIGTDTAVINQDIERAQAIDKLIKLYGVSAFAAAYPDLYAQIKDSPMILDAKIDMQKSKNDLEEALNPEKDKKGASAQAPTLQPRNDGSQFFAIPKETVKPVPGATASTAPAPVNKTKSEAPAEAIKTDDKAKQAEKPAIEVKPISLREIYGIGSKLRAVITYGNERTDVVQGDTLPDKTLIKSIRDKAIDIERDGKVITLTITG